MRKFIVWTGKIGLNGTIRPSTSLGAVDTLDEAVEVARKWRERIAALNRPCEPRCVITTYGAQKIVGSVPA